MEVWSGGSALRMLASRLCALMRFVASDMATATSEWLPMCLSTLFMSTGEPGSSRMNQAMAKAAACQWGLFHLPVLGLLKMNSRARARSSMVILAVMVSLVAVLSLAAVIRRKRCSAGGS